MAATITKGRTFGTTEEVTNSKLHTLVDLATIANINQTNMAANVGIMETGSSNPSDTDALWKDTSGTSVVKFHDGSSWTRISPLVSLEFVSTVALSAVATIEITNLASGFDYIFVFQNAQPATDSAGIQMRTSTDNGSNYDSGASDYTDNTDVAETEISVSSLLLGNAVGEGFSGVVILFNPRDTTHTHVTSTTGVAFDNAGAVLSTAQVGKRNSAADVDAVQFFFSSGNFTATGNLFVYRRQLS